MLTVYEAQQAILSAVGVLPTVRTPLSAALGYVLAEDVRADIDMPPFDNSAVDGYAVIAHETASATAALPILLRELPGVNAGEIPTRAITSGTCMRVMTGAPMPPGANAMVMREDTRGTSSDVAILAPAKPGDHIRRRAEHLTKGSLVLEPGTRIGPVETGVLAMLGAANPVCIRRPRVAVLSTGDELVDIARSPAPGQIRDSNRYALAALVAEVGADLHASLHLPDDLDATIAALSANAGHANGSPITSPALRDPGTRPAELSESPSQRKRGLGEDSSEFADVIISSGGVSVGDRDFIKPALESIGKLDLWRVNMKPGKPIAFGRIPRPDGGETLFFGLPGNPVSTLVTFELFVRPALWKLAGRRELDRPRITVRLTDSIEHKPGRQEFVRATAYFLDGVWLATPNGAQASANLGSMLGANALVMIPPDSGDLLVDSLAEALLLSL